MNENDRQIARDLVVFANQDMTQPPNWELDKKLKEVERDILQKGEYQRFADICAEAHDSDDIFENMECRLLFALGVLNGMRRLVPLPQEEFTAVVDQIDREVGYLNPGPRAERIWSFFSYQMGVYTSTVGDYKLAEELHDSAADRAEEHGNLTEMTISWFCAAAEAVNSATVTNDHNTDKALEQLNEAYKCMVEQNDGSDIMARWLGLNGPVFRLMAYYWACKDSPYMDADIAALKNFEEQYPEVFAANQSAVNVARACAYDRELYFDEADDLAKKVLENPMASSTAPEYIATAHTIRYMCNREAGVGPLQAALRLPTGAHQVKAFARFLLEHHDK